VPKADEPEAGFDRIDYTPPRAQEEKLRPAHSGAADLRALRALLDANEKRRQEETAEAKKQKRRQILQRVKDRVVGQWRSLRYTIPAETKARALMDIERELSALTVDELPEWELVQLAEGIRDKLYGPVMRAQDDAHRLEEQHRREEARRVAEERANEERERQQAEERISALVLFGTDFAYDALQDVEDLDEHEEQTVLQRVELELAGQLTGGESKRDVQGRVDKVLDEELGAPDDDQDEGDDDEDDDEDEEDDEDEGYEDDDDD
jgi:hypothetical protein